MPDTYPVSAGASFVAPVQAPPLAAATPEAPMPSPHPLQFQPSEVNATFGVLCGPRAPTTASTVQVVSESLSDVESVSRRMNELLSHCKRRLVTSRRSAQDAEEKLQVAEEDLSRIGQDWQSLECELEVARKLFDSEATSPQSNDSSVVPEEPLQRARRGWDILAETMSRSEPSRKPPPTTGPDRASALLAEALRRHPNRSSGSSRAQQRKGGSMLRWLEQESRRENELPSRSFAEWPREEPVEAPGMPLEAKDQQEPHSEPTFESNSKQLPTPRRGPTASDYLKMATVPPPKPLSRHDVWPSKGRNFYAVEADRDDTW